MKFRPSIRMLVVAGFILVGVASAIFLTSSESDWHPPHGSLWQSHSWLIDVPGGALGLEEWRLEGINVETSIYLGSFHFSVLMPAGVVAAIGLGSLSGVCWLIFGAWPGILSREYGTHAA